MRQTATALRGAAALSASHALWGALLIAAGTYGIRFASDTSEPSLGEIAAQQWQDLILPFLPAAALSGLLLGPLAARCTSRFRAACLGALAAPVAFFLTILAANLLRSKNGGYAAEQGMAALAYILVPLLALTASPLWAIATAMLCPGGGDRNARLTGSTDSSD